MVDEFGKLHTIAEAAEILNVNRSTIYALHDRGLIELVKLGDRTRVTDASLRDYVKNMPPLERGRERRKAKKAAED